MLHEDAFQDSGASPPRFLGARLLMPIPFVHSKTFDQRTPGVDATREAIEEAIEDARYDAEMATDEDDSSPAYSGPGRKDPLGNTGRAGLPHIDDYDKMRQSVDPGSLGRIVGPRSYRGRLLQAWAMNDAEVQRLLLFAFPRMHDSRPRYKRQREDAVRWVQVIYFYFRMKYPAPQVAEMIFDYDPIRIGRRKEVPGTTKIRGIVQQIQKKLKALRTGTARPRGRPHKNPVVVEIL